MSARLSPVHPIFDLCVTQTEHTALGQCVIDQQMEILRTKQKALSDLEEARFEIANLQVRATQELEEQKRKAREEADGFRNCIAEMQSKLEERHSFGKASATYLNSRHPLHLRVFLVRSPAHLALHSISTPRPIFTPFRRSAQRGTSRAGVGTIYTKLVVSTQDVQEQGLCSLG